MSATAIITTALASLPAVLEMINKANDARATVSSNKVELAKQDSASAEIETLYSRLMRIQASIEHAQTNGCTEAEAEEIQYRLESLSADTKRYLHAHPESAAAESLQNTIQIGWAQYDLSQKTQVGLSPAELQSAGGVAGLGSGVGSGSGVSSDGAEGGAGFTGFGFGSGGAVASGSDQNAGVDRRAVVKGVEVTSSTGVSGSVRSADSMTTECSSQSSEKSKWFGGQESTKPISEEKENKEHTHMFGIR